MFRGFNISFHNVYDVDSALNNYNFWTLTRNNIISSDKYSSKLKCIANDIINGNQIQADWFPNIKANIFLSHSHKDLGLAIKLAGYIEKEFGLKVFIDSIFWKYADDLQNIIDNQYNRGYIAGNYDYKGALKASSHINMMLANSIMSMIDKCECFFFLDTKNSINLKYEDEKYTYSPWINYELLLSKSIEKHVPPRFYRFRKEEKMKMFSALESQQGLGIPDIAYTVNVEHLKNLNEDDLSDWYKKYNESKHFPKYHPLDSLYGISYRRKLFK